MRSPRHRTSPSLNILTPEFLARLRELEEPASVGEAELAGPWRVEEGARGFAVLRDWQSGKGGDVPESVWIEEETALLAAVAVGAAGREPLFLLREAEGAEGFAVETAGAKGMEAAGWLRHYHPETVAAMHVLGIVARSPVALARVMQAAGALALEMAGEILGRRMMGE
jgi:hypothetical protein